MTLPQAFRSVVAGLIEQAPAECSDWRLQDRDGTCELAIPKLTEDGFEVTVIADTDEVTVYSEHVAHQHFTSDGRHDEIAQLAMGLVRDLLSPAMRLRVIEIRGKPVLANLEMFRGGRWERESTTAFFTLSFWRKRVERTYVNRRLPAREGGHPPVASSDRDVRSL